jgi:hypothetical protein
MTSLNDADLDELRNIPFTTGSRAYFGKFIDDQERDLYRLAAMNHNARVRLIKHVDMLRGAPSETGAARLIEAPDMPCYETLAGLTLEELEALPARFHIPRFDDCGQPNLWYCVPCSCTEGLVVAWPCTTAVKHGREVFEQ